MKVRILFGLVIILMISFSLANAIERVSRGEVKREIKVAQPSKQEDVPKDTSGNTIEQRNVGKSVEPKMETTIKREQYDNFIDRNNNGIDDRLEKQTREKKILEREVINEEHRKRTEDRKVEQKTEHRREQEQPDTNKNSTAKEKPDRRR